MKTSVWGGAGKTIKVAGVEFQVKSEGDGTSKGLEHAHEVIFSLSHGGEMVDLFHAHFYAIERTAAKIAAQWLKSQK
jgi:hypothetical protein